MKLSIRRQVGHLLEPNAEPERNYGAQTLMEMLKGTTNPGRQSTILQMMSGAEGPFDPTPLFDCYAASKLSVIQDLILSTLAKLKQDEVIAARVRELVSQRGGQKPSWLIFFAVAKHLEPSEARQIIQERFDDSPGTAAECLAKVGTPETLDFLREKLIEVKRWPRSADTDKGWHTRKITSAIRKLEKRFAK